MGKVFCDQCNTRLVPVNDIVPPDVPATTEDTSPGLQSISLPTRTGPLAGDAPAETELPDWLLELAGEAPATSTPAPAPQPQPAAPAEPAPPSETPMGASTESPTGELPDWLSNLAGEESGTSPLTMPSQPAAPQAKPTPPPEEEGTLPDWLSSLASDTDTFPDFAAPEPDADADMPSWLSSMQGDADTADETEAELPDWISGGEDVAPVASAPSVAQPASTDEADSWMSGLFAEEKEDEDEATPDWLYISEPSPVETSEPVSAQSDWLSGVLSAGADVPADAEAEDVYEVPSTSGDTWGDLLAASDAEDEESWPSLAVEDVEAESSAADWLEPAEPPTIAPPAMPAQPEVSQAPVDEAAFEPAPELPDWLMSTADTSSSAQFGRSAELPDWLTSTADTSAPMASGSEASLPEWILATADDDAVSAAPAMAPSTPMPAPPISETPTAADDWMGGLLEEESPTEAVSSLEGLYVEDEEPAADAAVDTDLDWLQGSDVSESAVEEAELPDWLQDTAEPVMPFASSTSTATPADTEEALPDWLSGAFEESEESAAPVEDEAASWLPGGDMISGPGPGRTPTEVFQTDLEEGEIPDWLREAESEAGVVAEPPAPGRTPTEIFQADLEEEEVPDWLREAESEAGMVAEPPAPERMSMEAAPADMGEETPDWLGETESVSTSETPAPGGALQSDMDEDNLPSWLRKADGVATLTARTPTEVFESELDEDEVPDWLREAEESVGAEEQPKFGPSDEVPVADVSPAATTSPVMEPLAEDWLSDLVTEEADAEAGDEAISVGAESPAATEVPDWLASMGGPGAPSAPSSLPVADESPAQGDVPKWLRHVGDSVAPAAAGVPVNVSPDATAAEGSPAWLNTLASPRGDEAAQDEGFAADDNLARANLPSWLQELRPPGTGPLPPLPADIAGLPTGDTPLPADMGGLARAEIPDWIQQLRPEIGADGKVIKKAGGPAESSGPLSGLVGVIMPVAGADMPEEFTPQQLPQISEAILQQAQLWQQLLAQPHAQARPVSQPRTKAGAVGAAVARIMVLLLILVAATLGLLMDERFASPSPVPSSNIEHLREAVDQLQAGDTVLVAMEYGFAEAPEMRPLAKTLLTHLQEREVNVVVVSTLPEGVGLADDVLASLAITNSLPLTESPYRVGAYSGVADMINHHEALGIDFLLVLAGRSERARWWVEQNAASGAALPMGMVLNMSTGAFMQPYLDSKRVIGWIVGAPDMLTYRQSLYGDEFDKLGALDYKRIFNAMMLMHWMAIALLIFGAVYVLVSTPRQKGDQASKRAKVAKSVKPKPPATDKAEAPPSEEKPSKKRRGETASSKKGKAAPRKNRRAAKKGTR